MSDELQAVTVPVFGRLADWHGVWAIEPGAGSRLAAMAKSPTFHAHVQAGPAPKIESKAEVLAGANGQRIAVVQLAGTLMKSQSSDGSSTSTVQVRRDLRNAANDPEVGAILLMVDSPGGTVAGTADLAADVRAASAKKPVWSYVADLGASAAYWVASQADKVFANDRTALIGSIGTLAVVYDVSAAAEESGVKTFVFGTGPLKGAGTPGAPLTEEQQDYYRGIVADAQKSFDAGVRAGRGLTAKQLETVKTGGVFGADEALSLGLIDGIKSFDSVLAELSGEARKRQRQQTTRANGPVPVRSASMNETILTAGEAVAAANAPTAADLAKAAAQEQISLTRKLLAEEAARVEAINAVTAGHPAIRAQAIAEGWDVLKAENAALKASLPSPSIGANFNPTLITRDNRPSLEALQAAAILRAGGKLDHKSYGTMEAVGAKLPAFLRAGINDAGRNAVMEKAHRFSQLSLVDICRAAVQLDGRDVPHDRHELIKAAFSGGTLTSIFTTSVNAMMLAGYLETGDTTLGWTRTTDVSDFKTQERIRLETLGGTMKKLPRGGEADHATRGDKLESYKISRFAEQFVVDEQDIIDDSMNALATMPSDMAAKCARLRPDLVYGIILANPTLNATSRGLFNATDGNLGSSSALASGTLKAAIAAIGLLRENSVNLNLVPTHLIVPWSLKWTAKELVNSTQIIIAGTAGSVTERGATNTLADENLQIVVEARLENGVVHPDTGTTHGGSATTWYMAAAAANTIEVAYLRGTGRAPQVRSKVLDGGMYGVQFDVCLDIGAAPMDWRGLRKTTA